MDSLNFCTELTDSEATNIVGGAAFAFALARGDSRGRNNAGTDNRVRTFTQSFPLYSEASSLAQSESAAE